MSRLFYFTIKLFYADTFEFTEENSFSKALYVAPDEMFNVSFYLDKSPPFLRLDLGDFYSVHRNITLGISIMENLLEVETILYDFARLKSLNGNQLIHKQILDQDSSSLIKEAEYYLFCGFDAFYYIENPFVGKDICFSVNSQFVRGFSE